ncbi:MFS transporter [Sphingomonas desiccabilis]|uniref:MFS transporter n=1 Tax=Sphingomonas desiccabilis TaxID=429134 RepID=A0A4Q2IT39_9SPHN|nr:MFS transporter [Sphingomonas desiccabilis]MBB3911503.1 CP family cyanate transporter-like MFS transporter [Sphingomonas desiccabilis]RXZ31735.1 MFS transporter [Sphingomonas desiccabilis]
MTLPGTRTGDGARINSSRALLLAGLLFVAANLRAPVTSIAPVLDVVSQAFALTPGEAGLLTTLPLLAFGIMAPVAPMLSRRIGLERSLFLAMVFLIAGILLRSAGPAWCLFTGIAVLGVGIAIANVLLPSLVKRDFPASVAVITGLTAVTMSTAAAIASAAMVPLVHVAGWQLTLASMLVLPAAAILVWAVQLGHAEPPIAEPPQQRGGGHLWRSSLAWQVTLFMGINSFLYYTVVAWLPSILTESGYKPATAGTLHGLMQLAAVLPGLVFGPMIRALRDQRLAGVAVGLVMSASFIGLLVVPAWASLWVPLFGMGSNGALLLALTFLALRTGTSRQTAALSGMAQCVGYLLAATGPILAGVLHDTSGGWAIPLAAGAILCLALSVFGLLAGRSRLVSV